MSEKKYFIDFGPELLSLLGPNLYTNIYYVLGEIIANAYDADAHNVYIIYNDAKNSIIIEDDGTGITYEQFNKKFLPIGVPTRSSDTGVYTPSGRKRMGRKGIGKLAALSVADKVKFISIADGQKSGCILSLRMSSQRNNDGKYEIPSVPEKEITFKRVKDHGSAVIMENTKYSINKTIKSAKRNISLIFPFTSDDFKIHLFNEQTEESAVVSDTLIDTVKQTDTLVTFSDEGTKERDSHELLHSVFDKDQYYKLIKEYISNPKDRPIQKELDKMTPSIRKKLRLKNLKGVEKEYTLEITGWIATYRTSKSKQKDLDFSPNHISIFANGKLGRFNILPEISTDRMAEAYVVGQFNANLLDDSELPDIAASNRQGYREDDVRYQETLRLIQRYALKPILDLRSEAEQEKNYLKNLQKENALDESKKNFNDTIDQLLKRKDFADVIKRDPEIRALLESAWELKNTITTSNKKLMISHASEDKEIIDILEGALIFCGFTHEEILYTSSDSYESRIGIYEDIYEYIRNYFFNTVYRSDLGIIYVLSKSFINKWNPTLEAGAGWIIRNKWYPMFVDDINSIKPPFRKEDCMPRLSLFLDDRGVRDLAAALIEITKNAQKKPPKLDALISYLKGTQLYK